MERKMSKKLLDWKNNKEKTPLILYGARQVGKTYTILSFGKENYKNVAYINFEDNTEISKIFEQNLEVERITQELSVKLGILPKVKVVINDGRPVISAICSAVQSEVFIISISNAAVI